MMNLRTNAWSRIGTQVDGVSSVEDAIKAAKMDFTVSKKPITIMGKVYDNKVATVRDDTNETLGIVGKDYTIVQNLEAFSLLDNLLKEGKITLEKIGTLCGGSRTWMIARMETMKVLGDDVTPYMLYQNSHDGSIKLRGGIAPLRIVCQNQFNIAFKEAYQSWSILHTSSVNSRLAEAIKSVEYAAEYMNVFGKKAEEMASKKISDEQFWSVMKEMFPVTEEASTRKQNTVTETIEEISSIYNHATDLQNFKGTAWGLMNAISDYITHREPARKQDQWEEKVFNTLVNDNKQLDKAYALVSSI